jgi:hypothetical protein
MFYGNLPTPLSCTIEEKTKTVEFQIEPATINEQIED